MISLQFLNGKEKPGSQQFIVIGIFTELFLYIRKPVMSFGILLVHTGFRYRIPVSDLFIWLAFITFLPFAHRCSTKFSVTPIISIVSEDFRGCFEQFRRHGEEPFDMTSSLFLSFLKMRRFRGKHAHLYSHLKLFLFVSTSCTS